MGDSSSNMLYYRIVRGVVVCACVVAVRVRADVLRFLWASPGQRLLKRTHTHMWRQLMLVLLCNQYYVCCVSSIVSCSLQQFVAAKWTLAVTTADVNIQTSLKLISANSATVSIRCCAFLWCGVVQRARNIR
ncbi:unnamed protein product, partial [Pylaiella littoralis]